MKPIVRRQLLINLFIFFFLHANKSQKKKSAARWRRSLRGVRHFWNLQIKLIGGLSPHHIMESIRFVEGHYVIVTLHFHFSGPHTLLQIAKSQREKSFAWKSVIKWWLTSMVTLKLSCLRTEVLCCRVRKGRSTTKSKKQSIKTQKNGDCTVCFSWYPDVVTRKLWRTYRPSICHMQSSQISIILAGPL